MSPKWHVFDENHIICFRKTGLKNHDIGFYITIFRYRKMAKRVKNMILGLKSCFLITSIMEYRNFTKPHRKFMKTQKCKNDENCMFREFESFV
jgi:hypothetical protein